MADSTGSSANIHARLVSYETLFDISRMLLGSATLEELFERISVELKRLVPLDAMTIYRVDPVRGLIVPVHSVDQWADEIMDSPLEMGRGLTGWVVDQRQPANLAAGEHDPRLATVPGTPEDEPEALVCVPLVVRDTPIGALNVYRLGEGTAFDADEFQLILQFADVAALAIDNAGIRDRLRHEAQTDSLTGLHNHRVFHERLRDELDRSLRYSRPLSVLVFDLDDFKLLNDVHGHQVGDLVLQRVAATAREELRTSDLACRIGGEEFAILLPETEAEAAATIADRLCARVRQLRGVRPITISCGVATYPVDASDVADLFSGADAALYEAKAAGKDRAVSCSPAVRARRYESAAAVAAQVESLSQLRALGTLAAKLNRLNDVHRIGTTMVEEMRALIDYHNARVYLLDDDGHTLEPIAFGGTLTEYLDETFDQLRCELGEGITGTAAQTRRTLNVPDANNCEFAAQIPGTVEIDESILAAPLLFDEHTVGVVVLAKLGIDQFSDIDVRVIELVAAQAAVSLEHARMFEVQRRASTTAQGLLEIATAAAGNASRDAVAGCVTDVVRRLTGGCSASLVTTAGGRPQILAFSGDESHRGLASAAVRQVADARAVHELAVADLGPVDAEVGDHRVAVAPVHGPVSLVVCSGHFTRAAIDTLTAVAGQAALALHTADLVATLKSA